MAKFARYSSKNGCDRLATAISRFVDHCIRVWLSVCCEMWDLRDTVLCLEDTKMWWINFDIRYFSTHDFVLFLRWANRCKIKTQREQSCNRRELWSTVINVHDSSEHHLYGDERNSSEFNQFNRPNKPKIFAIFSLHFISHRPRDHHHYYHVERVEAAKLLNLEEERRFFDVSTRLIAYYIPAKQQLHAFCKLEWAKSAIFCTRMTNFTEVLSYEFVTLLLGWLFLLLHAFATCPVGRRSWVGRICHIESAARCMQILSSAILKIFLLNFPQTRELSFRDGLLKMLMDSTRFIKFLRNFLWDMCKLLNYPYTEHRIVIVS